VLEAQSEKISELEGKINEMMEASITLKSNNAELVKEQVMSEVSSDLAETEIEKFKSLIEDVDYSNEASYREKLSTLKESYFPKSVTVVTETIDDVQTGQAQDVDSSGSMAAYMSAIGRTVNSAK
jgi:predicted HAD superfamily phosphohydrolase